MNRELLQQALEALCFVPQEYRLPQQSGAVEALDAELAKPDPDPVGKVLSEDEMDIGFDRRCGPVVWFGALKPGLLYLSPPTPRLPDGWVAVPVEPTKEMLEAVSKNESMMLACKAIYLGMLDAAKELEQP